MAAGNILVPAIHAIREFQISSRQLCIKGYVWLETIASAPYIHVHCCLLTYST